MFSIAALLFGGCSNESDDSNSFTLTASPTEIMANVEYSQLTVKLGKKELSADEFVLYNEKGQVSKEEKPQDQPSKLHARRQIMSYLYDIPEPKKEKETKKEYRERTKGTNHAVVEKLFRELAPKYDGRIQEGKKGGYTRMYKLGVRRGDAAPMVVLELV